MTFLRISRFLSCETLPIGFSAKAPRQLMEGRFEVRQGKIDKPRVKCELSDQLCLRFHGRFQFRVQMLDFSLDLGNRFSSANP